MKMTMARWGWKTIAAIGLIAFATQADAKRTLVDFAADDLYLEHPIYTFVDGYCDFGYSYECMTADTGFLSLGLSVRFGADDGDPDYNPVYENIRVYGNGQISFTEYYGSEDGTIITPGLSNQLVGDRFYGIVYEQSARAYGPFNISWNICTSSSSACSPTYDISIIPRTTGVTGLEVYLKYYDGVTQYLDSGAGFQRRYTAVPGVLDPSSNSYPDADETETGYSFFIPATFPGIPNEPDPVGGVPEPSTWAMMVMGFGAIGFALRRRRLADAGNRGARFQPALI